MNSVKLIDQIQMQKMITRISHEIVESCTTFDNVAIIGIKTRGEFLANRVRNNIREISKVDIPFGTIDITFHRDDFRRRVPKKASETRVPFLIEDKNVILVDDVLFTGRSVRAAMDAMISFGRPTKVELLVLIDRLYTRQLPIEANYVGKQVNTLASQYVEVGLKEQSGNDSIWLMNTEME